MVTDLHQTRIGVDLVGADDPTCHFAVVEQLEELRGGWLESVGVVRVSAMAKLTERRGPADESDALMQRVELLMYMTGDDESHRAVLDDFLECLAVGKSASTILAR